MLHGNEFQSLNITWKGLASMQRVKLLFVIQYLSQKLTDVLKLSFSVLCFFHISFEPGHVISNKVAFLHV